MSSQPSWYSVSVRHADFDVANEYQSLCAQAPNSGAVVFFVGLVRELYRSSNMSASNEDCTAAVERIRHLELQHYAGMTESLCGQIIEKANRRFPIDAARVVHRVGKLTASEQIVFVAVASCHRRNAFEACEYIMDYLKTEATLWKKEIGTRGEQWLGLKEQDKLATDRWQSCDTVQLNSKKRRTHGS